MHLSVAMCTYNGEKYIREQLMSIRNQTLRDELLIRIAVKIADNGFDFRWQPNVVLIR